MINQEPGDAVPRTSSSGGRRGLTVLIVIVIALLLTLRGIATMWTDFLWFSSVGASSVWGTLLFSRIALAVVASIIAFVIIWVNLVMADRISPRFRIADLGAEEELVERFQEWVEPRIRSVRLLLAAAFGVMIGLGASAWWEDALLFFNRVPFGSTDPVYNLDISFYMFQLPFYRDLFSWLFQLLVVSTLLVGAFHYLNGGIRLRQGRAPDVSAGVKAHLSVLLAGLAILKAIAYRLDGYDLLYSSRGAVFGASYTDVNAHRPALTLLVLISLTGAVLLLLNLRRPGWTLPAVAASLWLIVSVVVGGIIPAFIQRFRVLPNELNLEREFISNHIDFTLDAYGLDASAVQVETFAATTDLSVDNLAANAPTLDNVRLWDPAVLTQTYSQLQEIRTYYQLPNVDVDRYQIDGELTQVMIAARELDSDDLPAEGWVNERLVYTHGFGQVISPANAVNPTTGEPAFLVRDVPPRTTAPELETTQPRIYFGEAARTDDFVIVGTAQQEVDFPSGESDIEVERNTYDGAGGVAIGDVVRRAAFALRFGDLNTLISPELTDNSKILMVRNIRDRLERVAPLLYPDNDPYLTLIDGRLVWIVDLYAVSDQYPYSQPANAPTPNGRPGATSRLATTSGLPRTFNYIRNSVKAVVDAYDGDMTLYIVDEDDPLTQAYQNIFPSIFTPGSEMPDEVREHLRYPEDMFRVQSDIYGIYHQTNADTWFNQEDVWDIPADPSTSARLEQLRGADGRPTVPYYLLMRLPNEDELSYLALQSFNPANRPNMTSFLVAKSDPRNYGELIDYRLPRGALINGPAQVGARINQDPEISQQFTLLGQQGSDVIQGNLLVVPVEESILYIQPIYLQGEQLQLPEFKQVVVVFGEQQPQMRPTLEEALAAVFGEFVPGVDTVVEDPDDGSTPTPTTTPTTPPPPVQVDDSVEGLIVRIDSLFEEANTALSNGDLGTYQSKINEAQALLDELIDLVGPAGEGA